MKTIICIDPGINGAIAWRDGTGEVGVISMPVTPKDILEALINLTNGNDFCWLEAVGGYVPGNSGPAAVKFARHCGHLEMALLALNVSYNQVLPLKWQSAVIGKPNYSKIPKETSPKERKRILAERKTERKNKIKAKVQGLYPAIKVTLKNADALAMLAWASGDEK